VRSGGAAAGMSSATTSFASRFDRWKNRGSTSARFSGVMTRASWVTLVRWSRPSRRGSTSSGYLRMSPAAVIR
jgi:hypothetical protein